MKACFVGKTLQVNWILAYQPMDDSDDFVLYCESEEEAEDVHPSEVETWFCESGRCPPSAVVILDALY